MMGIHWEPNENTLGTRLMGRAEFGSHSFACGWNHTWKLHHTHGNKKVGLHLFICTANQIWKLHQHPTGNKKIGLHPFVCDANHT
jgi:hypothetical protein